MNGWTASLEGWIDDLYVGIRGAKESVHKIAPEDQTRQCCKLQFCSYRQ